MVDASPEAVTNLRHRSPEIAVSRAGGRSSFDFGGWTSAVASTSARYRRHFASAKTYSCTSLSVQNMTSAGMSASFHEMDDGEADLTALVKLCHLTPALVQMWAEAASVMFFKFHRAPPPGTPMALTWHGAGCTLTLYWEEPDTRAMASHANENDATEAGAYAVAIAAASHRGYVVRRRAHHGSGSDLLMVRLGEPDNDFVKLEVSGIARRGDVEGRLSTKAEQVAGGDLQRPGVAMVVHFEGARIAAREA